ncbi:MAG: type I glyceraldehyde-3-phosphate dehydrogenase [Nanoarchaeota archaeon]|nr:type I glyceraldehyde-3-phosphate dehydrogenase [Nanoarchaeota archaeon]
MVNVAINGFGRIGRVFLRAYLKRPRTKFKVTIINHPRGVENAAYLLKHDSVYGMLPYEVKISGEYLVVKGNRIKIIGERDIAKINWKKLGVDIVVECTGAFTHKKDAKKHLKSGAKRVIVSAPSEDLDFSVVLGVNDKKLDSKKDLLISNCSCTTNCLAPLVKVLNDSFGIERAFFDTIHGYTGGQNLKDGYNKKTRRGRAAAANIVPTTSGASISVVQTIPEMKGRLNGLCIRVPVITGSIVDLTAELKKDFTVKEINKAFLKASKGSMKGILEYSTDELVSTDIIENPHSAIFDSLSTLKDGNLVKILSWYDNEYGYSNRLVDLLNNLS